MATNLVNLDALIPREDFEVINEDAEIPEWKKVDSFGIRDLEAKQFFYNSLRKPDFQRETANWSASKICDFVRTFLTGDLIPAIILWKSGTDIFVIDGAHRLSALIAWVHNDYGDGEASRNFFQNLIPTEQREAAEKVRILVNKQLGTYAEHKDAIAQPESARENVLLQAKRLATLAIDVQWVTGNAKKAEASFFKINQEAVAIDKTELRILKARIKPNAIAARVIVRSATGHKYWSKFIKEHQQEVEELGVNIYKTLFTPELKTPLKTLDIPVAGRGYSAQALPLIFELVNLANDIKVIDVTRKRRAYDDGVSDDTTGEKTIEYLKNTRRIVYRISGLHPSSLGLHPAVYFYSSTGRYQPTSFLAMVSLMKEFDSRRWFHKFTSVRAKFENFWLHHKEFSNQITVKRGSGVKGFEHLKNLYFLILESLLENNSTDHILSAIKADARFSFLTPTTVQLSDEPDFDTDTKSGVFLSAAMRNPVTCKICGGMMHLNSITIDHIERRQDGGLGVIDNGQLAHPFCNTGFKESLHAAVEDIR